MMTNQKAVDIGTLVLRASLGVGMATHGWMKYANFAQISQQFPDLLGIGAAGNLALVVFAELVCALLVAIGLFTRLAAVPVIITMLVAFFLIHGADPFAKKEMAFLYLTGFTAVFFLGDGAYGLTKRLVGDKLAQLTGWKGFLVDNESV